MIRTVTLDKHDDRDITAAVATFQLRNAAWQGVLLPDGGSCKLGAILAEICRDWLESHQAIPEDSKGD